MDSTVTQASGGWSGTEGVNIGWGWKDTGNPGLQLSPDREADNAHSSCPLDGSPDPDLIGHDIINGNVTIHPTQ
jgi:hypothetical protein